MKSPEDRCVRVRFHLEIYGGGRGKRACTHPIVLRVPPRKPAARDLSNHIQSARAGNESVSLPDLKYSEDTSLIAYASALIPRPSTSPIWLSIMLFRGQITKLRLVSFSLLYQHELEAEIWGSFPSLPHPLPRVPLRAREPVRRLEIFQHSPNSRGPEILI